MATNSEIDINQTENPFEKKSLERQGQSPFEKRLLEKQSQSPFQKKAELRQKSTTSLWNEFSNLIFSEKETSFDRGIGSAIRGIAPNLAGIPGDLIQTLKLTKQKDPNFLQKVGQQFLEQFPTSEELKEKYDVLTEGKYKPQSRTESFLQEAGGDIATLLLPAKNFLQGAKIAGVALGGNLAKEATKELGLSPSTQEGAKIGTMFLLSMFNPKGARKFASSLYESAEAELPKTPIINSQNFSKRLSDLEAELQKGMKNIPSKAPVLDAIDDVRRNVKNGTVNIKNLLTAKRNLNEQRTIKIYDPEIKGRSIRKSLKENYAKLAGTIDDTIAEYGKTNPKFLKQYKQANMAWGGIEQSTKGSAFLHRHLGRFKLGLSGLAAEALFAPQFIPETIAGAAVGFSALKSYELMHRIMMNPTLRKYYLNTVINASKENSPAMLKSLKKLNEELEKS